MSVAAVVLVAVFVVVVGNQDHSGDCNCTRPTLNLLEYSEYIVDVCFYIRRICGYQSHPIG